MLRVLKGFLSPRIRARPQTVLSLVHLLLGPHRSSDQERIIVEGDDADIGAEAATALSLVFYELSVHATTHGALATSDGQVCVTCRQDGDAMTLVWDERGGPCSSVPASQRGSNLDLPKKIAWTQLGGELSQVVRRNGLTTTIVMPTVMLAR